MGQQEPELHEIHIEYLYDGKPIKENHKAVDILAIYMKREIRQERKNSSFDPVSIH